MKFNLPDISEPPSHEDVRVGNVYSCKGGGKTHFFIIVGVDCRMAAAIGINRDGVITTATAYGIHVFESRPIRGFVAGLDTLSFDIEWREPC